MELEVSEQVGGGPVRADSGAQDVPEWVPGAALRRPGWGRSPCGFPSCGKGATSRACWSPAGGRSGRW
jgi:hypothetical protein